MNVGIVIPCRNEEKFIDLCLSSVMGQIKNNFEIYCYVCDGESDDDTKSIVLQKKNEYPNIDLIHNPKRTTPFALNIGIKRAIDDNCSVIIILGAHSELSNNYVQRCIEVLEEHPEADCVGGILENVYHDKESEKIGKAMSSPFGVGNALFRTGASDSFVDTVAFGAYKKEVFEKIGFFDEELIRNQDDEFNYRLTKSGGKIFLSSKIKCSYFVRASFQKLFRQYMQYGYWKVYVGKKHKAVTSARQLIPFLFVLFVLVGTLTALLIPYVWIFYFLVWLSYFALALVFASKLNVSFLDTFGIIKGFLTLHISYGWGYLKGVVDFFILNKKIKKEEVLTR